MKEQKAFSNLKSNIQSSTNKPFFPLPTVILSLFLFPPNRKTFVSISIFFNSFLSLFSVLLLFSWWWRWCWFFQIHLFLRFLVLFLYFCSTVHFSFVLFSIGFPSRRFSTDLLSVC
ncbi:hypothetical protein QBC38DRAFT_490545 [Podospora fimiseda]|uniref:Transmembrane protein n=1 Tax=Podospora fimiseda TaxID=252190 RepID=A0AAN6YMV3_9PEZI|nr:hypothetical protein QBC38DRAFT_490545 [Podospora fimiseda]